jgi:hypothetical protein
MSIKIGTADVTDIKIGATDINYVYIGSTLIWQRGGVYSYELSLGLSYSTGTYILANGTRTATLTVTLKTYINGVYQSGLDTLVDADSITFPYEPNGTDFSATRTSVGTYTISAQSRGTVANTETDATIRVDYTPSGSSQIYETTTVSQEANAVVDTEYDTVTEIAVSSDYDSIEDLADAGETSWTVTASGSVTDYYRYEYTSGAFGSWVEDTSVPISASSISISVSGTGLSGSGTGAGTTVTWGSRGTTQGDIRQGTVTASYSGETDSVSVYQEANAVESSTNYVITTLSLDGVNDDIEISSDSDSIAVSGGGTYDKVYTSGSTAQDTFSLGASDISVSGTGFSYSNYYITVSENTGDERYCTVTGSYSGATSVQRTITQAVYVAAVAPTVSTSTPSIGSDPYTMYGSISDDGGATITADGFQWGYSSGNMNQTANATVVQSGSFSAQISGLIEGEILYYRAFATNSAGTGYGTTRSVGLP